MNKAKPKVIAVKKYQVEDIDYIKRFLRTEGYIVDDEAVIAFQQWRSQKRNSNWIGEFGNAVEKYNILEDWNVYLNENETHGGEPGIIQCDEEISDKDVGNSIHYINACS